MPWHLSELLHPTPSGVEKLLAAWDGLSTESKIMILLKLDDIETPAYLKKKIGLNALENENAYVRYLAVRRFSFDQDDPNDEVTEKKVENDTSSLVRYSSLEADFSLDPELKDADLFFELPHHERLARVRLLTMGGDYIANLISQAVDRKLKDGKVTELELYEILADYLIKPEFQEKYTDTRVTYDGWATYSEDRDIDHLWKLVPKVPEKISYLLIQNIPSASRRNIPGDVVNAMSDHQLRTLLYRKDIKLVGLRKKIFLDSEKYSDGERAAAITSNFQLDNREFANLLLKPPEEKATILKDLGLMASDLSLCIYDAIHDVLFSPESSGYFESAIYARDALERRIELIEGYQREEELTELRLYRLAKLVVPWETSKEGAGLSDRLEFLSEKVVSNDTWATYMAFSKKWSSVPFRNVNLQYELPQIYEIDEVWEAAEEDTDDEPTTEGLPEILHEKLEELRQAIQFLDNQDGDALLEGLDKVRDHATSLNTDSIQEVTRLHASLKAVESSVKRTNLLLYVGIGLVIFVLVSQ